MLAARNGHFEVLQTLVDAGAEINHKDGIVSISYICILLY
ncbi:hypothetical protein EON65_06945 [archaeon]|nr:MAG: hypothetical protein EON65_06945 [archaeon]